MGITPLFASNKVVVKQDYNLELIFSGKHKKYYITDDIDLNSRTIVIGEGSTLVFKGGSFCNGKLVGNNTRIKADDYEIFRRGYTRYRAYKNANDSENTPPSIIKRYYDCIIIEGTWNNKKCGHNWTGLLDDSQEDVMLALRNYILLHKEGSDVLVPLIKAFGYEAMRIPGNHKIDFCGSHLDYPDDLSIWEDNSIPLPNDAVRQNLESGYGLLSLESNTTIKNLSINGKASLRQNEPLRLGVSCIISIGNANNVTLENIYISNVHGPSITAQAGSKNLTFRGCIFKDIGEHIVYSHQYKGFCRFDNCVFDTWDSERLSVYRNGLNYLYKHNPPIDKQDVSYNELYNFKLQFNDCKFYNPKRINNQGRTLGGFITGSFPAVVYVNNCIFVGSQPALNPGGGEVISEESGKNWRLILRNCDGTPVVYASRSNYNIITEFYDCVNIPFRTVYAKHYERCELILDVYEDNIENVSLSFNREFARPLIIKDCEFIDNGSSSKVNHPVFHRPIIFENCKFTNYSGRSIESNLITIKDGYSSVVMFKSCSFNLPNYQLVAGNIRDDIIYFKDCIIDSVKKE